MERGKGTAYHYPLLIEPSFTLRQQGLLWSGLYLGFVAVCLPCAYAAMKGASPARAAEPSNRGGTSAVAAEARRPRWAGPSFEEPGLHGGGRPLRINARRSVFRPGVEKPDASEASRRERKNSA